MCFFFNYFNCTGLSLTFVWFYSFGLIFLHFCAAFFFFVRVGYPGWFGYVVDGGDNIFSCPVWAQPYTLFTVLLFSVPLSSILFYPMLPFLLLMFFGLVFIVIDLLFLICVFIHIYISTGKSSCKVLTRKVG